MFTISNDIIETMLHIRRDLHRHPELSNVEKRTANQIATHLESLGLPVKRNVGGYGLVCDLPGLQRGLLVALRADMDALPIQEETGLEFSSQINGVMHACGHDGHSSILVGAMHLLLENPPPLPVRLIWQPAEETATGARAMIADGVMQGVGMIFGGHVDRRYPAGQLIVTDGPVNASTDTFKINISGKQGHGARPHEAVDAVVVGSLLVTALQTIVSREVDPAHPSVVTIGIFNAGSAPNVIAGSASLQGTIRAQDESVRQHLKKSIRRIAISIGQLHDARVEVEIQEGTPPVVNTGTAVHLARSTAIEIVGEENVLPLHTANMGGEDFAYFQCEASGCYIRYGASIPGREGYPAHSSRFDFDEAALQVGALFLAKIAHNAGEYLLAEKKSNLQAISQLDSVQE